MEEKKTDIIELLLSTGCNRPEKELKMTRLSQELGQDVVFKIRALSYNAVNEFIKGKDDIEPYIVLEGLVSPDLKDTRLLAKYHALTPVELLRDARFLRAGEVFSLAKEIEELSGYNGNIYEEIAKN